MKQSIGATWITGLVVSFMLIFVSFLSLSVNYNKVFRIKNEALTIIEKYEGAKDGEGSSIQILNNYLLYNNYSTVNHCEVGDYGVKNLNTPSLEKVNNSKDKYFYCISKIRSRTSGLPRRSKYRVTFFFRLNLPIIGNLMTYNINGETIDINFPADNLEYKIT